ncbi:hypothetical protein [Bradyrhizobium sp. RT5a]|uniref:hypothetical protein n=1 Tax=Bradyrhizobium sp. RT5a TaxID=3156380 RepID=UPI00339B68BE
MPQGFAQNVVVTRDYLARIAHDRPATLKRYAFTGDDRFRADPIERLMCDMALDLSKVARSRSEVGHRRSLAADSLIPDGAVTMDGDERLFVRKGAEFLVRTVASAFDAHLAQSVPTHSRTV